MAAYRQLVLLTVMSLHVQVIYTACSVVFSNSLKTAHCMGRNLNSVPSNLDREIRVLDLSNNRITSLDGNSFRNYPRLQQIYIRNNQLSSISSDAFKPLKNLQQVHLDGNKLTSVPRGSFHHLSNLKTLILANNLITSLGDDTFRLSSLTKLSLENNRLTQVAPHALRGIRPTLMELNLAYNKLTSLSSTTKSYFTTNLNRIRLYNNSWNCDCNLRWLREYLQFDIIWEFGTKVPRCSAPAHHKGNPWRILAFDKFACAPVISNTNNTKQTVSMKGTATLTCFIKADPQAKIIWYKNNIILPLANNDTKHIITSSGEREMTSQLSINDVNEADAVSYICVAENSAGSSHVTFSLTVEKVSMTKSAFLTTTTTSTPKDDTPMIAGIVAGAVILLILGVLFIVFCVRQMRARRREESQHTKPGVTVSSVIDSDSTGSVEKKPPVNGYRTVQSDEPYNEQYRMDYNPHHNLQQRPPDYVDSGQEYPPYDTYNVPQGSYRTRDNYYDQQQPYYEPQQTSYYPEDQEYYPPNDGYTEQSDSYPPSDAPYYPDQYYRGAAPGGEKYHPSNPSIPSSEGPEPYYPDYIPANQDELRHVAGQMYHQEYPSSTDYMPQGHMDMEYPPTMDYAPQGQMDYPPSRNYTPQGQMEYPPAMDYMPQDQMEYPPAMDYMPQGRITPQKPPRIYGDGMHSSTGSLPHHGTLDTAITDGTPV